MKIKGQQISRLVGRKTKYDNDCLLAFVYVNEELKTMLLSAGTIEKMLNDFEFDIETKRIHSYLTNPKLIGGDIR